MSRDVPGNAMASQAAFERQMVRLATQLMRFEQVVERLDEEGTWLTGMSVRLPAAERADYLVVLRARQETGSVVCFSGGDSLVEALRTTVARLENRTVRWKEDQYAE